MVVTLLTGAAGPVEDGWAHDGALSRTDVCYSFANLFDDAAELVTHYGRVRRAGEAMGLVFRGNEYWTASELV